MPARNSAKKRLRQGEKRNLRNKAKKSALKTQLKKFDVKLKDGNVQNVEEELRLTVKKIDKSVTYGILHKNTANRRKARLAKQLNRLKAAG